MCERGTRVAVIACLLACAVASAAGTTAASASTLEINGTQLAYFAAEGEANQVSLTREGDRYVIADPGASIEEPDAPCSLGVDEHHASCPVAGIQMHRIDLDDEPDTFTIAADAYPALDDRTRLAVSGGDGDDALFGGPGRDQLSGDEGDDDLHGGDHEDVLSGDEGADDLFAGAGDDRAVDGGEGSDTLDAGPGDDEVVIGGPGNDTVDGGPGADDPVGGVGDDTVRGGEGDDRLDLNTIGDSDGADGADQLEGGSGDDLLFAGLPPGPSDDGDRTLDVDLLLGGDGTDSADYSYRVAPLTIDTDGAADDGQAGEDDNVAADVERILGGAEGDTLTGDDGPELLDGGPGGDQLNGLGGDDTLEGGINSGDSDSLAGGDGNDALRGGAGDDSLSGGAGTDDLRGGGGADTLTGEDGQDALAGGPGIDALDGGDGNDSLLGGDAVLVGADGNDDLVGGTGDDSLAGGPGNDRLDGGLGADRIGGDAGRDTVSYEDRNAPITVTFDGLPNDGEDDEGDNVASDVEIVISGAVSDTLSGDGRENELNAGSGDDFADAGPGMDRISGGNGADVLRARDGGRDIVDCGPGEDLAIVDRQDTARDCETVDRGTRRQPKFRALALVRPQGRVGLRIPGANRFVPFTDRSVIPLGSAIDTRAGAVTLATKARRGDVLEGRFEGARFTVNQSGGADSITELRLPRLSARDCAAHASSGRRHARAAVPIDRLVSNVKPKPGKGKKPGQGGVQTKAGYVSAAARGTEWLTEVRCDGTLCA